MLQTKELVKQYIKDVVPYNNLKPTPASFTIPANSTYIWTVVEKPLYPNFFVQFVINEGKANLTISDGTNSETAIYLEAAGIYISSEIDTISITNNEATDITISAVAYYNIDDIGFYDPFIGKYLFGYDTAPEIPQDTILYFEDYPYDMINGTLPVGVSLAGLTHDDIVIPAYGNPIKEWVYSQTAVEGADGFVFYPNQFFAYVLTFKPFSSFTTYFYLNCEYLDFGMNILDVAYDSNNRYIIKPAFDITNINIADFAVYIKNSENITAALADKQASYNGYNNVLLIDVYKDGNAHTLTQAYKGFLKHR